MSALPKAQVDQLKLFVQMMKSKPEILHDPDLDFLRDYIVSLGGTIPPKLEPKPEPKQEPKVEPTPAEPEQPEPEEEEEPESDLELDMTGVIGKLRILLLLYLIKMCTTLEAISHFYSPHPVCGKANPFF